jgi:hypothetical protein
MRRKIKLLETWQVLYDSFFRLIPSLFICKRTNSAFDLILLFTSFPSTIEANLKVNR